MDYDAELRLVDIVNFYKKDLEIIERNNLYATEARDINYQSDFMKSVGKRIKNINSLDELKSLENDINKEKINNTLETINVRFHNILEDKSNISFNNLMEIYNLVLNTKFFPIDEERENALSKLIDKKPNNFNTVNLSNYFRYSLNSNELKDKITILNGFDKVINYELKQIKTQEKIKIIDQDLEELSKLPETTKVNDIINDYQFYKEVLIEQAKMNKDLLDVIIEKYNIEDIKSL